MSSSNKVALAKLCKRHYHMIPITNHRHRYLLSRCLSSRCLSSVFTKISARKAKQSMAFGLLLLAGIFTTPLSAQITTGTGGICDRTTEVQVGILELIGATNNCAAVTTTQLAAITGLDLSGGPSASISTLQAGDFAGLSALELLDLSDNNLSMLPANVFDNLTNLIGLGLSGNNLSMLPANVFDNLTNLTELDLDDNDLDMLPSDVFDNLTSLTVLRLSGNNLDAGVFGNLGNLTNLTLLDLNGNNLSMLPANAFDNLTNLLGLGLSGNGLTALPAGVFDNLTNLTGLDLRDNNLDMLPAGVFDNLTNLTQLGLGGNTFTTPLPGDIFDSLPIDGIEIDLTPIGNFADVVLETGDTDTIDVSEGFISRDDMGDPRTLPRTLTYTATSDAGAIATATVTGAIVAIEGVAAGSTNVTITADDSIGTATQTISVTVVEAGILVFDAMMDGNQISTTTIAEASGTGTLYVQLAGPPETGNSVTISVASSDTNEGTVTPATLTFTDTNWNARQLVTVTAVPDNVDRGDSFMVNFAVTSGMGNYDPMTLTTLPSVTVTITDDDTLSDTITLSVDPLTVAETAGETVLTVTATLNGGAFATGETVVEVIVIDGGGSAASPNTDYTLAIISSGDITIPTGTITLPTSALTTITIPALETSASGTFAITPIADNENDNEETITISGISGSLTVNAATLTITGFSREEQQVIEQTVAAQASSVTQVVSENIGSFLASRTSAPAAAPAPPAPDGGGGGDINRENLTSIDWQDWQHRFAKLAYEGLKRLDSDADMSLDWALKAAGGDGRLLVPLGVESLTLWAAGGRLKTKGDGMGEYDGGVNSFVVGVDTNLINNWLLGIAASYSDSQVDYTMDGAPIGSNEQNLFSVHPFLSHSLPEHGLTLWVTGGYGVGDIDFSHTTNGEATSDVTQWMAAGGIEKHIITNTLWQGALRLKGLWGNATVDATEYDNGVEIRKVESTFWRARMESEMGYNFQLPGANVRPYALIGGRWDHNDAIVSGDEWHIDIGGGVEVLSHNAFALNISLHTQLTDGDTEEDSIVGTGSLTYDIGHDRQGLQISLSRPLNNTSPAWDQHSFNEVTDKVSGINSAPLTSELAYGWTVRPWGLKGALQTYVQNSFDSHDRHYAVGLELAVNALTLNFESGYGEAENTGLESMLKTKIRW